MRAGDTRRGWKQEVARWAGYIRRPFADAKNLGVAHNCSGSLKSPAAFAMNGPGVRGEGEGGDLQWRGGRGSQDGE